MTVLVRAAGEPNASIGSVADAIREFDPRLRTKVTTGDSWVAGALGRERFVAGVALVITALAVLLACNGVYAAVSNAVAQRRRELAIRAALGASRARTIAFVLVDPMRTAAAGAAAGIPLVLLLEPSIGSLLFGVPVLDGFSLAVCGAALLGVAAGAAIVPAVRGARVDPVVALRTQ